MIRGLLPPLCTPPPVLPCPSTWNCTPRCAYEHSVAKRLSTVIEAYVHAACVEHVCTRCMLISVLALYAHPRAYCWYKRCRRVCIGCTAGACSPHAGRVAHRPPPAPLLHSTHATLSPTLPPKLARYYCAFHGIDAPFFSSHTPAFSAADLPAWLLTTAIGISQFWS